MNLGIRNPISVRALRQSGKFRHRSVCQFTTSGRPPGAGAARERGRCTLLLETMPEDAKASRRRALAAARRACYRAAWTLRQSADTSADDLESTFANRPSNRSEQGFQDGDEAAEVLAVFFERASDMQMLVCEMPPVEHEPMTVFPKQVLPGDHERRRVGGDALDRVVLDEHLGAVNEPESIG